MGWFNQNPPAYRWQHNLMIDWTSPDRRWGGGLENRFYSSYIDEYPLPDGENNIVGSYSLWDIYASYKPINQLTVLFGIKNVFNTSPPFTDAQEGNFAAGYNTLVADPLLRNCYINLKLDIL